MQAQIQAVREFLLNLQQAIVHALENQENSGGFDGRTDTKFLADTWERPEGGGGRSCVLSGGQVIEKAGVMFSHIHIKQMPASATVRHPELVGAQAQALGVSLVVHPKNPYVPTSHANVRLFVATPTDGSAPIWWFGGGFDLTPFYPNLNDVKHWHQVAYELCQPFGDEVYPKYKTWCDEYFYLKHRHERRGVGGLFYDDMNTASTNWDFMTCFKFMQAVGQDISMASYQSLSIINTKAIPSMNANSNYIAVVVMWSIIWYLTVVHSLVYNLMGVPNQFWFLCHRWQLGNTDMNPSKGHPNLS